MAFETCKYGGLIPDLKNDYVNMDLLFNTMDRNSEAKVSNFMVEVGATINQGGGALGVCNAIPVECGDADQFDVTAVEPLSVNYLFDDCLEQLNEDVIMHQANTTARRWGYAEATYAYSIQNPILTDITADIEVNVDLVNLTDEIVYGIEQLVNKGYNPVDMVVGLNTSKYYESIKLDLGCCDFNIQTAEANSILNNKLGVKRIIHVPTNVLSGNVSGAPLTPETTACWAIYIQDYAMFKTYCEYLPEVRNITDVNYAGDRAQLIGKEIMGHGYYNSLSGVIRYEALPPLA